MAHIGREHALQVWDHRDALQCGELEVVDHPLEHLTALGGDILQADHCPILAPQVDVGSDLPLMWRDDEVILRLGDKSIVCQHDRRRCEAKDQLAGGLIVQLRPQCEEVPVLVVLPIECHLGAADIGGEGEYGIEGQLIAEALLVSRQHTVDKGGVLPQDQVDIIDPEGVGLEVLHHPLAPQPLSRVDPQPEVDLAGTDALRVEVVAERVISSHIQLQLRIGVVLDPAAHVGSRRRVLQSRRDDLGEVLEPLLEVLQPIPGGKGEAQVSTLHMRPE